MFLFRPTVKTMSALALLVAMSAARCARTSYLTHDKQNPSWEQDDGLYRRLVESKPLHASPLEHQAYNCGMNERSRNFTGGWIQHRALLESAGSIDSFRQMLGINIFGGSARGMGEIHLTPEDVKPSR